MIKTRPDKEGTRPMLAPLPPNDQPPGWFMPFWIDRLNWRWDDERQRFALVLHHHRVQIIVRKNIDWTWRCQRLDGQGAVMIGGYGLQMAKDARCDCLATMWSDLWTGRDDHARWRQACAQHWPEVRFKAIAAERREWAAEIETKISASGKA